MFHHWALGIGHWALGIGHWALGIGHWASGGPVLEWTMPNPHGRFMGSLHLHLHAHWDLKPWRPPLLLILILISFGQQD